MNPFAEFSRLADLISPAVLASRRTFDAYRKDLLLVVAITGAAVLIEAAGFAMIYLLLRLITGESGGKFAWAAELPYLDSPLALTLATVVLLTIGIRLRYAMLRRTIVISLHSGRRAGELALVQLRGLLGVDASIANDQKKRRNVVLLALKDIPFAAGFAARNFSLALIALMQATVIFALLVYISPALTMLLLLASAALIALLAIPFRAAVSLGEDRVAENAEFRTDLDWLADHLGDEEIGENAYLERVRSILNDGSAERQFSLRLEQRQERQTGTLILGYMYPLGAVALALMYFYSAEFAPPLSLIAVYFLMFRHGVVALQAIGKAVIMVSKQHDVLTTFRNLLSGGSLGDELPAADTFDDDDE